MGNLLWKWTTTTTEMENNLDESDGVISNDDITKLLYVNEEENICVVENILDMSITDIHNKRATNVLLNLCSEYNVNFEELDVSQKEIIELGYIGPGKELLTTILEFFFKENTVMRMHAILHDSFGMFYRKTKLSNGYYYRSTQLALAEWKKKSPLIGHITGILFCIFYLRNHKFCE